MPLNIGKAQLLFRINKVLDQNSVTVYVHTNKGKKPRLIQIEEMDVARFGQTSDN